MSRVCSSGISPDRTVRSEATCRSGSSLEARVDTSSPVVGDMVKVRGTGGRKEECVADLTGEACNTGAFERSASDADIEGVGKRLFSGRLSSLPVTDEEAAAEDCNGDNTFVLCRSALCDEFHTLPSTTDEKGE